MLAPPLGYRPWPKLARRPAYWRRSNRLCSLLMFSHIGIHLGVPKDWKSFKYPTGSRWLRRSFKVGNSWAQPPDESKEGFGGGGMIVCPRQRAKPLMSLHHERIHYARQGNAALNAEEREAARCRYITHKVIGAYSGKINTLYGLYKLGRGCSQQVDSLILVRDASSSSTCEEQKGKLPLRVWACYFIPVNWPEGDIGGLFLLST